MKKLIPILFVFLLAACSSASAQAPGNCVNLTADDGRAVMICIEDLPEIPPTDISPTGIPPTGEPPTAIPPTEIPPTAGDWFVSRSGNNSDGKTWATAWNEMDQIDWGTVNQNDSILLAEGLYETPLIVSKGVTIKVASGVATLFGGRSIPLPYCGQNNWNGDPANHNTGISIKADNVIVDGGTWSGLVIHGFGRHGINISGSADNVLVRNVEIYDNGNIRSDGDPDQEGVNLHGSNVTFERAIVHDNGQDAFQSGGELSDFTLRESWLYNTRLGPNGEAFNECRHPDGIQIFGDGVMSGVTIEESVIGPGFLQGVLLGGNAAHIQVAVSDVIMRDVLFMKNLNANIHSHSPPISPTNWTLDRVTAVRREAPNDGSEGWWNTYIEGTGHTVTDSVFYGGRANGFPGGVTVNGNCRYKVEGTKLGRKADPQFVNFNESDMFSLDDFTVQNLDCEGSNITSVADLLSR